MKSIIKVNLYNNIEKLPPEKIAEVSDFVNFLINKYSQKESKRKNLKGIWFKKGFEEISDIEKELTILRESLSNSIGKKEF